MPLFDLPADELTHYKPLVSEPSDFDVFWKGSIAEARQFPSETQLNLIDFGIETLQVYDVTFNGYGGQPIRGWLLRPSNAKLRPVVVEYLGYGGGRGNPWDWLFTASMGYNHLIMDTRGQAGQARRGDTPDSDVEGSNPHVPGFVTRGILSRDTYYFRRVIIDAVRAVDATREIEGVDQDNVFVTGRSQGGGVALAVAGLLSNLRGAAIDVPFLCHFERATRIVDTDPYQEIVRFCKSNRDKVDRVFETLSYYDGVNFAKRASASTLFSAALMDQTCPPSTVYAAFNHYRPADKDIAVYPFNGHEAGGSDHEQKKVAFFNRKIHRQ